MAGASKDQRPSYLQGALYGIKGRLASLSTAVTQVKIDIERKRSLSPTGEGLPPAQAAQAASFREGLQWALSLLDSHISDTVLHAADDEVREAGERTAAARHAARE